MFFEYTLGIDPSGEYTQGKGTTGWCLIDSACNPIEFGSIYARDFNSAEAYWKSVFTKMEDIYKTYKGEVHTVIEDYIIYPSKLNEHSLNRVETCRLLGYLQVSLDSTGRSFKLQKASIVKSRWSDEILKRKGILRPEHKMNNHERDALRHAVHQHYVKRRIKKDYEKKQKQKRIKKEFKSYE